MATAWELCLKLGFLDGDTCTRGSSNMLLDEIEAFVKTWDMSDARTETSDFVNEIQRMTNFYLYWRGAGDDHWGKPLSNGYCNLLEWPKDSVKITNLLRELFSLMVKKQLLAKNTTLVASSSDANTIAGPPTVAPASVNVQETESHVGALTKQRHADYDAMQLITRLFGKEAHSVSDPFEPIDNGPAPVVASSEKELMDLITAWITEHPGTNLDGLKPIDSSWLNQTIEKSLAQPVHITHNQETFQLNRFRIEKLTGWILKRIDGSCMLVKHKSSNRYSVTYQTWLGGDLGFTSERTDYKVKGVLRSTYLENLDKTSTKQEAAVSGNSNVPTANHRIFGKNNIRARTPAKARSTKLKAKLKDSMPKRLPPARKLWRTASKVSVAAELPQKAELHTDRPSSRPFPTTNHNVVFQFFLADERHGAIPQPLANCATMSSFFDGALAAWGALDEEPPHLLQARIAAVNVIIEDLARPIVVLWRNKEGFERMMETVLEQADETKKTKLNVEVRCFKRK